MCVCARTRVGVITPAPSWRFSRRLSRGASCLPPVTPLLTINQLPDPCKSHALPVFVWMHASCHCSCVLKCTWKRRCCWECVTAKMNTCHKEGSFQMRLRKQKINVKLKHLFSRNTVVFTSLHGLWVEIILFSLITQQRLKLTFVLLKYE